MKHYTQVNRFLQKYGFDAFKIIAAYEEATDIPQTERYASWYGDYGIFEPSLNAKLPMLVTLLGIMIFLREGQ